MFCSKRGSREKRNRTAQNRATMVGFMGEVAFGKDLKEAGA